MAHLILFFRLSVSWLFSFWQVPNTLHFLVLFCPLFSMIFNIMSALSVHQLPTLPQKIDSRGGWFWYEIGLVCECGKMNFYLKTQPCALVFGLFAAKWSAFWCKTECVLVLNGVRFDAKWSVFCCKTQGVLVLNAVQNAAKSETKSIKIHCNGINKTFPNH